MWEKSLKSNNVSIHLKKLEKNPRAQHPRAVLQHTWISNPKETIMQRKFLKTEIIKNYEFLKLDHRLVQRMLTGRNAKSESHMMFMNSKNQRL